ncbi:MAG: DUF1579 domain-containing protein, partial [Phycisphaerae bacterium]|nr:DUF1579 domain-containing protein [Phycisphaerae bacterium]
MSTCASRPASHRSTRIVAWTLGAVCIGAIGAALPQSAPSSTASSTPPSSERLAPTAQPSREISDASARAMLGQLAGFWRVVGKSFDERGESTGELTGSAAYSWSLGGHFLAGEQVLTDGPEIVQWIDYLGFNSVTQTFSRSLFSDRDSAAYCAIGLWDPGSRLLTFVTDPIRGPDGAERRIRSTLDLSIPDQPAWELAYLVGSGAEEKQVASVDLRLTRAIAPTGTPVPSGPLIPGGSAPGAPRNTNQPNPGGPGVPAL